MRSVLFPLLFILLVCSSCNEEPFIIDKHYEGELVVKMSVSPFIAAIDTKSELSYSNPFSWEKGNKISIFPHKISETRYSESQIALAVSSVQENNKAYSNTVGWQLMDDDTYDYFSYYPFSRGNTCKQIKIDYSGQIQIQNNSTSELESYDYRYSEMSLPESSSEVSFTYHHISSLVNVRITVPDDYKDTTFYKMCLCTESEKLAVSADYSVESIVQKGAPELRKELSDKILLSFGSTGIKPTDGIISAWLLMLPSEIKGETVSAKLYAAKNNVPSCIGTFVATEDLLPEKQYSFIVSSSQEVESPLPETPSPDEIFHILFFGHSFSVDCSEYLPSITRAAGIKNVHYGHFMSSNCSLYRYWEHIRLHMLHGYYNWGEKQTGWVSTDRYIDDVLREYPWDIIVFQQCIGFNGEGDYSSYQPDLDSLTNHVVKVCEETHEKTPVVGWNMFWGYNSDRSLEIDKDATKMYEAILTATHEMMNDTNIKLILPSGTALQNARGTSLNTSSAQLLLRADGHHASAGIGRYVAACTWYQRMIAPIFGIDITGNTYRPSWYSFEGDKVDDHAAAILQKCAVAAVEHPFEVTKIVE